MDEYQAATLAIRTYALWAAYGQVAATLVIGGGQIAVVLYGIRAMIPANRERAVVLDQQHQADDKRHEEAMAEGARRHEEAMGALKALIGGLERQTASLETVVERTAPTAGPAE